MMNRYTFYTIFSATLLLGADFWKAKLPPEWTPKEAQRLLENSPWARDVEPEFQMAGGGGMPGGGMGGPGGGMGGGGMGGPGGGMGGPGGGGGGMGGPGAGGGGGRQMPKLRVTFETARPVIAAKGILDMKDVFSPLQKQFVVISVSGMPMMPGRPRGAEGIPQEGAEERLLQLTTLKLGSGVTVQPAEVKMQQTSTGSVVVFAFPRNELALKPGEKQITFKTSMGPLQVQTKFNVKDMVFDKEPSL